MTVFASDAFTDTNSTLITAHDSRWVRSGMAGPSVGAHMKISSNKLYPNYGAAGCIEVYRWNEAPPSADYSVSMEAMTVGAGYHTGPAVRVSSGTANDASSYGYYLGMLADNGEKLAIKKRNGAASVYATLASMNPHPLANNTAYVLELEVSGSSTTTLKAYVQRISDSQWLTSGGSWGATKVACMTVADSSSPYTAAGFAGLLHTNEGDQPNAYLDNFTAAAPSLAPPPRRGGPANALLTRL